MLPEEHWEWTEGPFWDENEEDESWMTDSDRKGVQRVPMPWQCGRDSSSAGMRLGVCACEMCE